MPFILLPSEDTLVITLHSVSVETGMAWIAFARRRTHDPLYTILGGVTDEELESAFGPWVQSGFDLVFLDPSGALAGCLWEWRSRRKIVYVAIVDRAEWIRELPVDKGPNELVRELQKQRFSNLALLLQGLSDLLIHQGEPEVILEKEENCPSTDQSNSSTLRPSRSLVAPMPKPVTLKAPLPTIETVSSPPSFTAPITRFEPRPRTESRPWSEPHHFINPSFPTAPFPSSASIPRMRFVSATQPVPMSSACPVEETKESIEAEYNRQFRKRKGENTEQEGKPSLKGSDAVLQFHQPMKIEDSLLTEEPFQTKSKKPLYGKRLERNNLRMQAYIAKRRGKKEDERKRQSQDQEDFDSVEDVHKEIPLEENVGAGQERENQSLQGKEDSQSTLQLHQQTNSCTTEKNLSIETPLPRRRRKKRSERRQHIHNLRYVLYREKMAMKKEAMKEEEEAAAKKSLCQDLADIDSDKEKDL